MEIPRKKRLLAPTGSTGLLGVTAAVVVAFLDGGGYYGGVIDWEAAIVRDCQKRDSR